MSVAESRKMKRKTLCAGKKTSRDHRLQEGKRRKGKGERGNRKPLEGLPSLRHRFSLTDVHHGTAQCPTRFFWI